jgi:hypothetical protein
MNEIIAWLKQCRDGEDAARSTRWNQIIYELETEDGILHYANHRLAYEAVVAVKVRASNDKWLGLVQAANMTLLKFEQTFPVADLISYEDLAKAFCKDIRDEVNTPRCHHLHESNVFDIALAFAKKIHHINVLSNTTDELVNEAFVNAPSSNQLSTVLGHHSK